MRCHLAACKLIHNVVSVFRTAARDSASSLAFVLAYSGPKVSLAVSDRA